MQLLKICTLKCKKVRLKEQLILTQRIAFMLDIIVIIIASNHNLYFADFFKTIEFKNNGLSKKIRDIFISEHYFYILCGFVISASV